MNSESRQTIDSHYTQALGLTEPWRVSGVTLDTNATTVDIEVIYDGSHAPCPECGKECHIRDARESRRWRHLDMMQFVTTIHAKTPRTGCPEHGVKSIPVPWADEHSRFTLLFERFAVEVLQAAASVSQAQSLLHLSWEAVQRIKERAVERGLSRRNESDIILHVGIDEKSFLKGHRYATLATDLDAGRVLDVVENRTLESAKKVLKMAVSKRQLPYVEAGAMDMWEPFMKAWAEQFPYAPIVHDRFHVAAYLGKAVDAVRKQEHRLLKKEGDNTLTGAKYLFLKDTKHHTAEEKKRFQILMNDELKVGRAWTLKEAFRHFWEYVNVGSAETFFKHWYFRATHSRLKPMVDVAKMMKRHLDGLLAYCRHQISNAVTEGLNSKSQSIKSAARGFRSFEHYRIAILFGCGKLDMMP